MKKHLKKMANERVAKYLKNIWLIHIVGEKVRQKKEKR